MYKILFDDNFYNSTIEQREYFDRIIKVIQQYFDARIVYFVPFNISRKTIHNRSMEQIINRKILDTELAEKYDLSSIQEAQNDVLETQMCFSQLFVGKLKYVKEQNPNSKIIIPLCFNKKNRELSILQHYGYLFYIGNFDEEVNSNIAKWIQENCPIYLPSPSKNQMFPAKVFCDGYDLWRSEILKSFQDNEKIADFEKIGTEVAYRNHYTYDHKLSELNKRKAKPVTDKKTGKKYQPKRKIFKSISKDILYLSIDFENGGFEVYDKNATHLGQYKFNGEFDKDSKHKPHPLYLK